MRDRWKDGVRKIKIEKGHSVDSKRKCRGMRMDILKGGGRLNRRVVFDRGVRA